MPASAPTPCIMVVDDDPAFRSLCIDFLEDEGYRTKSATNQVEAEHEVMASPPDLIILDVHLASASGFGFLRLLRSNPDTLLIPVIMTSADRPALSSGISDLDLSLVFDMGKPFDLIDLGDLIVRALAQASVRRSSPARSSSGGDGEKRS